MLKNSFLLNHDVLIVPQVPYRSTGLDGSRPGMKQKFLAVRTSDNEVIDDQVFSAWNNSRVKVKTFFDSWFQLTVCDERMNPLSSEFGVERECPSLVLSTGPDGLVAHLRLPGKALHSALARPWNDHLPQDVPYDIPVDYVHLLDQIDARAALGG